MKQIRRNFITGLVTILPLVFLGWIASLFYTPISTAIGINGIVPLVIGIAIVIVSIIIVGWLFSHIRILKKAKQLIEQQILYRIPGVKIVYKFAKDLLEQVLANKTYDKTVIAYPFGRNNAGVLGFLTNEEASVVFVTSSPSPLTGHVYIGCEYDLLDWEYEDAIKFNVSMGMSVTNVKELLKKEEV